jgi:hypothetical protein
LGGVSSRQAVNRAVRESREVAEHSLAMGIGEAVALHLGQLLGELLPKLTVKPACEACSRRHKLAARELEIDTRNAKAAAEPAPERDLPPIRQAFTQQDGRWTCYEDFEAAPREPVE